MSLLAALPADFALPILVVQHLASKPILSSRLPAVLGWRTSLPVKWAVHGEALTPGTVYVAPPDQHLLVSPLRRIALSSDPKIGPWRPAVDALFASAADVYGAGVAAVILSGMMWDGAKGIAAVAKAGGITIAQDEHSCGHFEMPAAALDIGHADMVMSPRDIARALQLLTDVRLDQLAS
jgi:two-component system chemotaxis response regulator CheB